jgi:hypothetical protein
MSRCPAVFRAYRLICKFRDVGLRSDDRQRCCSARSLVVGVFPAGAAMHLIDAVRLPGYYFGHH